MIEEYNADPAQVHVAGASSGAGVAVILATTYPDVFATATSVAGGEYGLNQVDPDDPDATPPEYTARQAWAQMGARAAGAAARHSRHGGRGRAARRRHTFGRTLDRIGRLC